MAVKIEYKEILDKCVKLSAYDGKQSYTEQGVLRYKTVKIVAKDFPGLMEYIRQAVGLIEKEIEVAFDAETWFDDEAEEHAGLNITVNNELQIKGGTDVNRTFLQAYVEAIVCYVMSQWMADKVEVRSKNYMDMYVQMLSAVKKIALSKKKPVWEE